MAKQSRFAAEHGAVIIQVAVALLALAAISSLVLDYGIMWASRGQAQTSADAGALAGAVSLAFDNIADTTQAKATAKSKAQTVAKANNVWAQAPDVQLSDITFPTCPPGAPGVPDTCVKVDVYRNQTRSNALPTFFANLVGVSSQGVRATATAQVITGNTTDCLRPWVVVDRWLEGTPTGGGTDQDPGAWNATSTYDKYSDGKGNNPPPENDVYTPPTQNDPGTGFRLPDDEGRQFAIKTGAQGGTQVTSGWFQTIDLARSDTTNLGNATVQSNINSCTGVPASIAAPGSTCPSSIPNDWASTAAAELQGCFRVQTGATVGSTRNSINTLVAKDPNAYYSNGIQNSAYDPPTKSPRVVPIGVIDIDQYLAANPTGQNGVARMVNIFGFFIEGMGDVDKNTGAITLNPSGQNVVGRIITIPGLKAGSSSLTSSASFIRTIILVR